MRKIKSYKKVIRVVIVLFFLFIIAVTINFRYLRPKSFKKVDLVMAQSGSFEFNISGTTSVLENNINNDKGFIAALDISEFQFRSKDDVPYLIGDTADARLVDRRVARFKIEIISMTKDEIIMFFDNDKAEVGDELKIDFGVKTVKFATILPLSSIAYDETRDEYYVFLVEQFEGAWSKEYRVVKKTILPDAYYHDEVAFMAAFFEDMPVILNPEEIVEGELVRFF